MECYKTNAPDLLSCMSFNLWGGKDWEARAEAVLWEIKRFLPDTFGIQEGKRQWLELFERELSDIYECAGVGNREANYTETFDHIYYKKDRFELKQQDTIWLSDDIHAEGSKFAESKRVRIAVFAWLYDRNTKQELLCANTHLDNLGDLPREMQVKVLLDYIRKVPLPCVLTGDFNSRPESEVHRIITEEMNDSRTDAIAKEIGPTYNGAGEYRPTILDYCFFSKERFVIEYYRSLTDLYQDSVYPSDHNPVYTEYRFQ